MSKRSWADIAENEEQNEVPEEPEEPKRTEQERGHKKKNKLNPYERGLRDGLRSLVKETPYQIGYRHGRNQGNAKKQKERNDTERVVPKK